MAGYFCYIQHTCMFGQQITVQPIQCTVHMANAVPCCQLIVGGGPMYWPARDAIKELCVLYTICEVA